MSEPLGLDGIEARANAATPGPWERTEQGFTSPSRSDFVQAPYHDLAISDADAEFIAHAREDVPALVAEVRALRAKVAAAEALPPETAMEVPTRVRVVRVDDLRSALSRERPAEPPPYHFRVAEDGKVEPTR